MEPFEEDTRYADVEATHEALAVYRRAFRAAMARFRLERAGLPTRFRRADFPRTELELAAGRTGNIEAMTVAQVLRRDPWFCVDWPRHPYYGELGWSLRPLAPTEAENVAHVGNALDELKRWVIAYVNAETRAWERRETLGDGYLANVREAIKALSGDADTSQTTAKLRLLAAGVAEDIQCGEHMDELRRQDADPRYRLECCLRDEFSGPRYSYFGAPHEKTQIRGFGALSGAAGYIVRMGRPGSGRWVEMREANVPGVSDGVCEVVRHAMKEWLGRERALSSQHCKLLKAAVDAGAPLPEPEHAAPPKLGKVVLTETDRQILKEQAQYELERAKAVRASWSVELLGQFRRAFPSHRRSPITDAEVARLEARLRQVRKSRRRRSASERYVARMVACFGEVLKLPATEAAVRKLLARYPPGGRALRK